MAQQAAPGPARVITVAFDVDGTLRQVRGSEPVAREDIRTLMQILRQMENVRILVWSGAGELYARQVARKIHVDHWVDAYAAKDPAIRPDITIDDENITLGTINLVACGTSRA